LTVGLRYRAIENSQGTLISEQLQHNEALRGRVKFDARGAYALNFVAGSGSSFTSGWNNTGAGTGDPAFGDVAVRHLFVSAAPVKGIELLYGGMPIARGESTEITTYDNDGYVMGLRASLKRPADVYFDEISGTAAFLGPLREPGVLKRFEHLDEVNYAQVLVAKKLGARAVVSADYTYSDDADLFHQALRLGTKESVVVDAVRIELYQRRDVDPASGFAFTLDKAITKRLSLSAGYADIDPAYGGLNADRFNRGRRAFVLPAFALTRDLSVSGFYAHALDEAFAIVNASRFDVVVTYNVLAPLQRRGIF
jgi:hypothetical protein